MHSWKSGANILNNEHLSKGTQVVGVLGGEGYTFVGEPGLRGQLGGSNDVAVAGGRMGREKAETATRTDNEDDEGLMRGKSEPFRRLRSGTLALWSSLSFSVPRRLLCSL